MEIYCYIMSLMLSILTLISTIIIEYKEIVYDEITMFGIKEIIICMIASIITRKQNCLLEKIGIIAIFANNFTIQHILPTYFLVLIF